MSERNEPNADFTALSVATAVLRHARLLIGGCLLGTLVALVSIALFPRRYASESTLVSEADGGANRINSVAAQLGVSLPAGDQATAVSASFYEQLVRSRAILLGAIATKFSTPHGQKDLVELYGADGKTPLDRTNAALDKLREDITAASDLTTNIVTVRVQAQTPTLAADINRRILVLMNDFNVMKRRTQAAAERAFLAEREKEAQAQRRAAEERLESFFAQNRSYMSSPQLVVQAARLQREVDFQQQLYTGVAQAYEHARLDEVRNTPTFTIIDAPEGSSRPTGLGPIMRIIFGVVVGLVMASAVAIVLEVGEQSRRAYPAQYQEFSALRSRLLKKRRPAA